VDREQARIFYPFSFSLSYPRRSSLFYADSQENEAQLRS
jgi:hypothetical protein